MIASISIFSNINILDDHQLFIQDPRGTFQRSEFSVGDVSAIENDESQLDHERLLDGKDMEEDV